MSEETVIPEQLAIIAGNGRYPQLLAESAREQGVRRLVAAAFRGEASRALSHGVDEIHWLRVGALARLRAILKDTGSTYAVMAGQITPTALFRAFPDADLRALLRGLHHRNAHTIFGAVCADFGQHGITMLPASRFMEKHMPAPGLMTRRSPTPVEESDIALGLEVARSTSGLDIGQTVVVKEGTIVAVEAFEGTDRTIRRAGKLSGPGSVVIKRAKPGHDMRFDIPVIGLKTLRSMKKAGASALALEAGRCILMDREAIVQQADALSLCITVLPSAP